MAQHVNVDHDWKPVKHFDHEMSSLTMSSRNFLQLHVRIVCVCVCSNTLGIRNLANVSRNARTRATNENVDALQRPAVHIDEVVMANCTTYEWNVHGELHQKYSTKREMEKTQNLCPTKPISTKIVTTMTDRRELESNHQEKTSH